MDDLTRLPVLTPATTPSDRIGVLDVLRGLALLGMYFVHFNYYEATPAGTTPGRSAAFLEQALWLLFSERFYGRFERRIPVDDIDEDKVSASFRNGELVVTLPRSAEAQRNVKRIAINGK